MPMRLKNTGYTEMQGELKLLQEAVRVDATRKSVRAGAAVIRDAIEERTPMLTAKTAKSTALDLGVLKGDIGIRMERVDQLGFLRAWIGPRRYAHVARWVEYGHRLVKGGSSSMKRGKMQGAGRQVGEVEAHPFIRPAFEASQKTALAAFAEEMRKQLGKWVH